MFNIKSRLATFKINWAMNNHHIKQRYRHDCIIWLITGFIVVGINMLGQHFSYHTKIVNQQQEDTKIIKLKNKDPILTADVPKTKRKHNFVNEFNQLDAEQPKKYQLLPSIVIAQAAEESNWGNSPLYQEADNAFGIKGSYHGHSITLSTREVVKHKRKNHSIYIKAKFKKYPSLKACVLDHNRMVKKHYLDGTDVDPDSYISIAKALQHGGYATDPNYANALMTYVEANHLDRFD